MVGEGRVRSCIAYYYNTVNTRSSRRRQFIIISRSIACEPTSLNVKKQKSFFGFWEAYAYTVFWQVYCNVRTHVGITMQWCVRVWQIKLQCNTAQQKRKTLISENILENNKDACWMLQLMCWTRTRTTLSHVPNNTRAILPDTSYVPLDLSCVTIARRDFMIGLSSFYSFNNSHFWFFEIWNKNGFFQPFANFIKGAHS